MTSIFIKHKVGPELGISGNVSKTRLGGWKVFAKYYLEHMIVNIDNRRQAKHKMKSLLQELLKHKYIDVKVRISKILVIEREC